MGPHFPPKEPESMSCAAAIFRVTSEPRVKNREGKHGDGRKRVSFAPGTDRPQVWGKHPSRLTEMVYKTEHMFVCRKPRFVPHHYTIS